MQFYSFASFIEVEVVRQMRLEASADFFPLVILVYLALVRILCRRAFNGWLVSER